MFRELPTKSPGGPRAITHEMIVEARQVGRALRRFGCIWAAVWIYLAVLFGMIFSAGSLTHARAVVGGGLALGALGIYLFVRGQRARRRALDLFRRGDEIRGEVTEVWLDKRQRWSLDHPWKVRYRFELNGRMREGVTTYWTTDPPEGLDPGREVVVLHDPVDPDRNILWTEATPTGRGAEPTAGAADGWRDGPYALVDPTARATDSTS